MRLQLKNISIIKEADINLDGLTVIAGKNDTGKSTVGKVLYALIKSINIANNTHAIESMNDWYKTKFNSYIKKLFKNQLSNNGTILLNYENVDYSLKIEHNFCKEFHISEKITPIGMTLNTPLLIETPFIWSLYPLLKTLKNVEHQIPEMENIDFEIPLVVQDLYYALSVKYKEKESIELDIKDIIDGQFVVDNFGNFIFNKNGENIELINTAMGIKYFGIFQVLLNNNHFYKGQILILDEPEVHLHPSWQLKLAQIIVKLVKYGLKVILNSHSPYMIEALQRYAQKAEINNNFYLANEGIIMEDEKSLSRIFEKLSEPFREFDKMDSEIFHA